MINRFTGQFENISALIASSFLSKQSQALYLRLVADRIKRLAYRHKPRRTVPKTR